MQKGKWRGDSDDFSIKIQFFSLSLSLCTIFSSFSMMNICTHINNSHR